MEYEKSRTWAEVNLKNLAHNALYIKSLLPKDCQMMCSIKANAYGHGMLQTADIYQDIADQFAVACFDEARKLRLAGHNKPILILGYTPAEFAEELANLDIMQTVYSYDYAEKLNLKLAGCRKRLKIHIKINSGMNRLGFSVMDSDSLRKSFNEIIEIRSKFVNLEFKGLFTHFHSSDDEDSKKTDEQFEKYITIKNMLTSSGVSFEFYHCCNSAAVLKYPHMHLNMVRPGISLYGIFPGECKKQTNLKHAMEVKTRIGQIHTVKKGESIGYNATYVANRNIVAATVPIGYADGYSRAFSNKGIMLVEGKRVPVVGNICMDQCVLDVTSVNAKEGDIVTVLGSDCNEYISATELSEIAGTIPHELFCSFSDRVLRIYID